MAIKNYKEYYNNTQGNGTVVTITCNSGEKIEELYWMNHRGEMYSIMEGVSIVENTYTLEVYPRSYQDLYTLIINCSGKIFYTTIRVNTKL